MRLLAMSEMGHLMEDSVPNIFLTLEIVCFFSRVICWLNPSTRIHLIDPDVYVFCKGSFVYNFGGRRMSLSAVLCRIRKSNDALR